MIQNQYAFEALLVELIKRLWWQKLNYKDEGENQLNTRFKEISCKFYLIKSHALSEKKIYTTHWFRNPHTQNAPKYALEALHPVNISNSIHCIGKTESEKIRSAYIVNIAKTTPSIPHLSNAGVGKKVHGKFPRILLRTDKNPLVNPNSFQERSTRFGHGLHKIKNIEYGLEDINITNSYIAKDNHKETYNFIKRKKLWSDLCVKFTFK